MKGSLLLGLIIMVSLANAQVNVERYNYFFEKSKTVENNDLRLSSLYADSLLSLIQEMEINNDSLEFEAYYQKANVLKKQGDFEMALQVLSHIDTTNLSLLLFSDYLNLSGVLYESKDNYIESLSCHLRSLAIRKRIGDPKKIAIALNSIAFVYRGMNQQEKAIEVLEEMMTFCPKDDPMCNARALFNTGLMVLELDRHEEAIPYFRKAVQGLEEQENLHLFSVYYNNLANCYERLLHIDPSFYDSSILYGNKSLAIKQKVGNLSGVANSHNQLAATYERASDYKNSRKHALLALELADSLGLKSLKRNALSYLITAQIELEIKDNTSALFEDYIDVVDELRDQATSEVVNDMAARYDTEKKVAENNALREESAQQKKITFLLIGIAFILILLIVLLIYLYRLKLRTNVKLAEDKDVIQKQSEKLVEVNDLKSRFFANISHELRTPLTLIQGNADAILRLDKIPAQAVEPAKKIRRNVKQMTVLVNDLLDLSKLELQRNLVKLKPLYLDPLVARVVAAFLSLAESNLIELDYHSDIPQKTVADLDEGQFEKVMNNLIYNSFKFVTMGGRVNIHTFINGDNIVLKVVDNGRGIPDADLPYIFDRFYQAGMSEDNKQGSGLGLAISKELIELMHGKISAYNNPEGGATLEIQLPVSNLMPSLQDELISTDDLKSSEDLEVHLDVLKVPSDSSVLIVEDNKLLQSYLSDVLRDHFELHIADNGKEALDLLKQVRPDLILTDVMMPVMDGWELLGKIREDAGLSKIPVIVLTAVAENADRLKGLRLGVDDYIIKPFEVDELLVRISNVINNLRERIKWAKEFAEEERQDLSEENQLVIEIRDFVKENMADSKLNVTQLAMHLGLSERQLYRKTAESVGLSPSKLITEIRLQQARELLVSKRYDKLAQISQEIGFESTSYFSKLYLERFGKKPTDYFS